MTTPIEPAVSLRAVTPNNFAAVVQMQVRDDQARFVASNLFSLAEAQVFPGNYPLAIYAGEQAVGFCMHTWWEERKQHWINRLMIDPTQQRKGYARAAMHLLIERMRLLPDCREIYISYDPANDVARALYRDLGFVITGERIEGEEVARLDLEEPEPR